MYVNRSRFGAALLAALLGLPGQAPAHPVSQVSVDADIDLDAIRVNVEVKAEDLVWFHHPEATNNVTVPATLLRQAAHRHQSVLQRGLQIYNEHGERLPAQPLAVDPAGIDRDILPAAELKTATVHFRFSCLLAGPPAFLTFRQTFGGTNPPVPCSMDLTVRRQGEYFHKPVNLPAGVPFSFGLNWNRRAPTSLAEIREHRTARFRRRLGITDFSGLHSFIHLGTHGVRHEIILPHQDLTQWLPDFGTRKSDRRTMLAGFLRTHCPLSINGAEASPQIADLQFHGLETIDFGDPPARPPTNVHQTRVAIVIEYPSPVPCRDIRLTWTAFTKQIPFVKSMIFSAGQPPRRTYFTAQRPTCEWRAPSPQTKQPPLARLMLELANRLDVPPNRSLLARLQPPSDQRVQSGRLEAVSGSSASWTLNTVTEHWGHRHEHITEYTADLTIDNHRLNDLRIRDRRVRQSITRPVTVSSRTFIRGN